MKVSTRFSIFISVFILFILDYIYLTATKSFSHEMILNVQHKDHNPRIFSTLLCYIIVHLGLWFFVLRGHRPPIEAVYLGLVIYGAYETTNYAIFNDWRWEMVVMDTMWGGILFGLTTYLTYMVENMF
jgi:uncharacterized membrane protein